MADINICPKEYEEKLKAYETSIAKLKEELLNSYQQDYWSSNKGQRKASSARCAGMKEADNG